MANSDKDSSLVSSEEHNVKALQASITGVEHKFDDLTLKKQLCVILSNGVISNPAKHKPRAQELSCGLLQQVQMNPN